ncbi:MAG TPA: primosomal protein N' [Solirubrobacteraceae bacterium]
MPGVARVEPITTARALRGPFDYARPEGVGVGAVLVVPFGRQEILGVVTAVAEASEHELVAPRRVLEQALPEDLVTLAPWIAAEYCSTPARAFSLMLPPKGVRARTALHARALREPEPPERLSDAQRGLLASLPRATGSDLPALRRLEARGLVAIEPRVMRRAPVHTAVGARASVQPLPLTPAQGAVLADIEAAAPGERLLLHGVTGSGKTEVYLHAAARTLDAGRTVLVLVPEIALTPQIVARFQARFGDTVAVLHSQLSPGERYDEWLRLRRGEARICVGPRSAVFAPLADIGLIVVDEEHDASYKHEGDPRYDARHVADRRARDHGAVLVAGSATPRAESWHALRRISLPERVDGARLPPVETIDLRGVRGSLHPRTHEALVDARKSVVLLNRRGWSNYLSCQTCGHAWECPSCDVTLVLHRASATLACHHCGHRETVPSRCVECGSVSIARHGTGTERLETELPGPVFRLDGDAGSATAVLAAFERADRGILLGTQMVAKGHDFPDVELGVVVDADQTLRFPDFRAEERTFALVAQLAGRAGRGPRGGRVLVQTLVPDAPSILLAGRHDAATFLAGELERRRALSYPPFSTLIRIVCASERPGAAHAAASALHARLPGALGPAPLFRLRGKERAQVVLKAEDRAPAVVAVGAAVDAIAADRANRGVSLSVDVDPQ